MKLSSVYLYSNNIEVFTNSLDSWVLERYRKVYNRNLKIYRGADNRIDVQVKNSSQKGVSVSESYLVFTLVVAETDQQVLQKDCILIPDDLDKNFKGRAYVELTRQDLLDLETGFYKYSVALETRDYEDSSDEYRVISRTPMYMDSQYGSYATLEIFGDIDGETVDSLQIREFNLISPRAVGDESPSYYESTIINAHPLETIPSSIHTFQFYHSADYTGRIRIQGSLSSSAHPNDWVDIPETAVVPGGNNFTTDGATVSYRNVIGKWNWFRVISGASFNGSAKFVVGQTIEGVYNVAVYDGGKSYAVNQVLTLSGDRLGGFAGVNDLNITITSVNYQGAITGIEWTGTSVNNTRSFVLGATGAPSTGKVDKILYR
jgi:hypothetical protein